MIQLHVHSHFSPLGGLSSPEELILQAKANGEEFLAITDTNGVYGMVEFLGVAKEHGIKAIVGSEIIINALDTRFVILVKSKAGYEGLCQFLSALHQEQINQLNFMSYFEVYKEDMVVFSRDRDLLLKFKKSVPELDIYFELNKGFYNEGDIQWAKQNQIQLLASNQVRYIEKKDHFFYKLICAIKNNQTLDEVDISDFHNEHSYYAGPQESRSRFSLHPEAIANTIKVAQNCEASWYEQKTVFPKFRNLKEDEAYEFLRDRSFKRIPFR